MRLGLASTICPMTNGQMKPLVIEIILIMPNIVPLKSFDKSDGNGTIPPACRPFVTVVAVAANKNNPSLQLAIVAINRQMAPPIWAVV
ncbi:hypothetical protein DERP_002006 [Dermatophagoides pteronyssinus]|uniref:Uncharacterized protein n=1 Tax=Dermatophagoides pteronyssinus TaxID=6956 RepID=A0ABQ8JGJ0_DERPT|nr:hypothetical protein DERP_002006 [Dermatophagoides pteronyssinus]